VRKKLKITEDYLVRCPPHYGIARAESDQTIKSRHIQRASSTGREKSTSQRAMTVLCSGKVTEGMVYDQPDSVVYPPQSWLWIHFA